jgi:hypothetical protein
MTDDPVSASSRGFTSKNEKKTEKYRNKLEKYFKDHKLCERIHKLLEEAGSIMQKQIKRDMMQLTMMLQEECCRRSKRYDPVELFNMTGLQNLTRGDTEYDIGESDVLT